MKRILPLLLIILTLGARPFDAAAQRHMSDSNRREWKQRMRELKHNFLSDALGLSREQQNEFFPLYDAMEDEIDLMTGQARELEAKLEASPDAVTDLEYSSAAKTIFEQKGRENKVEMEYFAKFEDILTPRQLFLLRKSERDFTAQVVRRHGRMRSEAPGDKRGPAK